MSNSKVFGSTLIIAGTTIGAGMLALPIASAGLGFTTALIIMVSIWLLMAYTALLMLEVHQYADADATLHALAYQFLGRKGQWVATFAMLFLFYSLCAAYIAGGGGQFHQKLLDWFSVELPSSISTVIFTILVASIVTFGTQSVDRVNRVLFSFKIIALTSLLFFLTPSVQASNLQASPLSSTLVIAAIPVIFTSFGFHGSIPAVVRYLKRDIPSLKKVLLIGSLLPLLVYILWELATLGIVSQHSLSKAKDVNDLVHILSLDIKSDSIGQIVSIFADLALVTSFLGVSLGLFEFLADSFRARLAHPSLQNEPSENKLAAQTNKPKMQRSRFIVSLITFLPPLGFALYFPQGFIMALGFAAIALAILAVLLPVAMVIKLRAQNHLLKADNVDSYQVAGGRLGLILALACGFVIILIQLLVSFHLLPTIG